MRLPKWRKMTWLFVIVQILFLVWLIAGISAVAEECSGLTGDDLSICEAGTAIGASIGAGIIIVLWVLIDMILGITWLVTNKTKTRECPRCGTDVKKGLVQCPSCEYRWT